MKKSVFKFFTYMGLFFILPILKLFGKNSYEKNVVPKLVSFLCGTNQSGTKEKKSYHLQMVMLLK